MLRAPGRVGLRRATDVLVCFGWWLPGTHPQSITVTLNRTVGGSASALSMSAHISKLDVASPLSSASPLWGP